MSYSVGDHKNGGHEYTVTVNGLVMTGWRCGNRDQVEEYARQADRMCVDRAAGMARMQINKNGKRGTSHLRGKAAAK